MYVDAHTHLNDEKLFDNWQDHIKDFENIWWKMIINAWSDDGFNKRWIQIAKEYEWDLKIKATVWFHPFEIISWKIDEDNLEEKISGLKKEYLENKEYIVAIWEAGIDINYKWNLKIEMQKRLFKRQCKLAKELDLPIVIHSRDDFESTIEILKKYKDLKIYFHCWGYGPKEVKIVQKMFGNVRIWFCANISYPKAQNIRDSLLACDMKNILLETDAPYLPPQEFRWKTNYPVYVSYTYDFVSNLLNIKKEDIENKIFTNFHDLYKK